MDIVEELDRKALHSDDDLFWRASDAIVLEREITDKLYRALQELLGSPDGVKSITHSVAEALDCYHLVRLA